MLMLLLLLLLAGLGNGSDGRDDSWCRSTETGPVKRGWRPGLLLLSRLLRHAGLRQLHSRWDDSGWKYARREDSGLRLYPRLGRNAGLLLYPRQRRNAGLGRHARLRLLGPGWNFAGRKYSRLRNTRLRDAGGSRRRSRLGRLDRRRRHARKLFPEKDSARSKLLGGG